MADTRVSLLVPASGGSGALQRTEPPPLFPAWRQPMRKIQLLHGLVALVDDQDYAAVSAHKWSAACKHGFWYAHRRVMLPNGIATIVSMHREILGLDASDKRVVDHINHNGLDNRCNIRPCTQTQNHFNAHSFRGTSRYKGVHWHRSNKHWVAKLKMNGKPIHLGCFKSEVDAARAYNNSATQFFGAFALLNEIPGGVPCNV
jgi:hypothetical protein